MVNLSCPWLSFIPTLLYIGIFIFVREKYSWILFLQKWMFSRRVHTSPTFSFVLLFWFESFGRLKKNFFFPQVILVNFKHLFFRVLTFEKTSSRSVSICCWKESSGMPFWFGLTFVGKFMSKVTKHTELGGRPKPKQVNMCQKQFSESVRLDKQAVGHSSF